MLTRGSNLALLCVILKKRKLNRRAAPIKGAACSVCCGGSAGLTHYAISKFCSNLNAAVTAHHHVPNNVVMRVFNHKLINSCTQILYIRINPHILQKVVQLRPYILPSTDDIGELFFRSVNT